MMAMMTTLQHLTNHGLHRPILTTSSKPVVLYKIVIQNLAFSRNQNISPHHVSHNSCDKGHPLNDISMYFLVTPVGKERHFLCTGTKEKEIYWWLVAFLAKLIFLHSV